MEVTINLINAPIRIKLKIINILGGHGIRHNLAHMGIGIGSMIIIDRNAPFSGPLIIEHNGMKFAIGRGIASRIIVLVMK